MYFVNLDSNIVEYRLKKSDSSQTINYMITIFYLQNYEDNFDEDDDKIHCMVQSPNEKRSKMACASDKKTPKYDPRILKAKKTSETLYQSEQSGICSFRSRASSKLKANPDFSAHPVITIMLLLQRQ